MSPEVPYQNREIREMFSDVQKSLSRIEKQTTTTNGRVSKLEMWRSFMTGGLAVLTLIVVPILSWSLFTLVNIQSEIDSAINTALSAYNIKVK